jgi:phage terminase large subunit
MSVQAQFPEKMRCLFEPKRTKVFWGGRGAGRSWGIARALLLIGTERAIRVLCCRELQKSIEDSVHKLLADQIEALGLGAFYTVQKAKIIGVNGTSFSFEGIKNNTNGIKSYEAIDYAWVEEANKVSKASWNILLPTIRKAGSEIWISFNPELETDYTYDRFVKNPDVDNSIVVHMNFRDNPWFPKELEIERLDLQRRDADAYINVWEGRTIQQVEGAVYARELRAALAEGRICKVPYDKDFPVNIHMDLGRADNTSLWFSQRVAMQWRMLRFYEASGHDISHFIKYMQRCEYVIGRVVIPHDGAAKRLGSKKTIEEQIRAAGFKVSVQPAQRITDGINAARMVFNQCWFDEENTTDGLSSLRHYRYKVIDGQLSKEPLHDWASDGSDAFRYFALDTKGPKDSSFAGKIAETVKRKLAGASAAVGGAHGWMN